MAAQTVLFDVNLDNIFNGFVACGQSGRAQTSPDGQTWTARAWAASNFQNMAFGNDVLVVVASNTNTANMIYTSIAHDLTPTARTHAALGASIGWYDVAFGNNTWVAVAGGASTQYTGTSTNSITWTLNSTALTSADWQCIAFGDGVFVALAYNNSGQGCSDYARYSTDGVTWYNGSGLPKAKWRSVCYDPVLSRFVAVSQMPLRVSGEIISFTAATKTITRTGSFATDTYFVGGTITVTGSTSNNTTFTIATVGTTTITVNETVVEEAGSTTEVITPIKGTAYSDDGVTWSVPTSHLEPSNWICVASNGLGRVMTITNTASRDIVAYSDDGINWTSVRMPYTSTWYSIGYGNNTWVATTALYTAYSENNGITWNIIGTGNYQFNSVKWIPFPIHTGDTLTIDRGATVTCDTDQRASLSSITITNGKLRIENDSNYDPIRFVMARTSGSTVQSVTPSSGLGSVEVEGDWIEIGEGDGSSYQELIVPYTDYVPCLWVETGVGTNVYEIWLNVSGAYGGTLRQYADGLLDVSTGQRGKFFTQTPNAIQDKYITRQATITNGLMTITLDSADGLYQGASITGSGIPANTLVEEVINDEYSTPAVKINVQPTLTLTNVPVRFINPYSSQFTNTVLFGNGINGNKLTSGVRVLCPNIMLTVDTPANLQTSSQLLGLSFVMTSGGKLSLINCLMDEAYHNLNQTQRLYMENVGLHIRPTITEVYDLTMYGVGMGMPAVRRFLSSNIWTARDIRDTLTNSLLMNYITGAVIDDLVMVLQSPHAITAAAATAPTGMLNIANSDSMSVSNVRVYSLNTTRAYQCGLAFPAPVTNSLFDNIEVYGLPLMSLQFSSNNTFTNLVQSESMFSFSHNYTAGTRVTYDPNTGTDMVDRTQKYYFKSRTFHTRDRVEYTQSRTYSMTPFKGSTYFPDYITVYCNAPQSVVFGWIYRVPMYTADTQPAANADAKNFIEIYRGTSSPLTPALSNKVAGLNPGIHLSIPTVATWATEARTIKFDNIIVSASGGRTMTFDQGDKTIVCSSGSFISDGFAVGDKIDVTGTSNNNRTYTVLTVVTATITVEENTVVDESSATAVLTTNKITASSGSFITDGYAIGDNLRVHGTTSCANNTDFTITNVKATIINVSGTLTTQSAYSNKVFLVAKFKPASKIRLTAAGGRTLKFDNIAVSPATEGVNFTFATATTITRPSGSFSTNGFAVGDKVWVTNTTYNNTAVKPLTVTAVAALTLTFANDYLRTAEGVSTTATLTVNKITASSGDFTSTERPAVGDILDISGSANANNNRVFTLQGITATILNVIETVTTNAAESSGALINFKNLPTPKVVYANACNNDGFTFVRVQASADAVNRIFTFNAYAKTITSTGASPGSFITDGFVAGDKVVVTGTTYNNKVTLTLTGITATVLTAGAATERQYTEVSTTAVLSAYHITRSAVGTTDWRNTNNTTDGFAVGDTITVTGTGGTNDGTFAVSNVTQTYLHLADAISTQPIAYSNVVIIANKRLPTRQNIYFTSARTFATTAATRTITASAYSFLQDGYIPGDKVLINGGTLAAPATGTVNGVYTLATVATTTVTTVESLGSVDIAAISPTTSTWIHTGQRPSFSTTATITLAWTAATKTLTIGTGSFDGTYNFKVGDKLFITGQYRNNGIFTIASLPGAPASTTLTVTEPVVVDTTTYNATVVSTVYGYHPTQKVTVTAASGRTFTYSQTYRSITASTGSFINDGYAVGDCIQIQGTQGGINDGYFTIASLTATVMQFNEVLLVPTTNPAVSSDNISAPNILDDTTYYYVVRKYDDTGAYNDSAEIEVTPTLQGINTNMCLKGTAFTATEWTASGVTVGSATRISPFVSPAVTQTAEAIMATSTTDGGTLTQTINTAINNTYTFSLWVCTQPTIVKVATLTATASRTLKWDSKSVTRTVTFNNAAKTIVAGSGDFTTDFAIGDKITITGTVSNNRTVTVQTVVALTITVEETSLVDEASVSATLKCQKITAGGASPGDFTTDGHEIGDHILTAGCTAAQNNGWFTITNVKATILNLAETVVTESAYTATANITNNFNDTLSIAGSISLGTATQAFTATAQWQKVSVSFTATATTHNAVITFTSKRRGLCIIGAKVDLGSVAKPYLSTTTVPVSNANEVRDINVVRSWCRGYGEPKTHSGIAPELAISITGELWTEVYCGTTAGFTPSQSNKVYDTWAGTGYTMIFNQASQNNVVDNFDAAAKGAPINYGLAYFASTSSGNKIKNLTYDLGGALILATAGIASFNSQSNDMKFYNWNIKNYRNFTILPSVTTSIFGGGATGGSNATSGLIVENMFFNNSDFPIQCLFLNSILKGVGGGNLKPTNFALLYAMPIAPVYVLGGGTINYDSLATSSPTIYTTVYDTIFNELYFTETTGALSIVFNASAKEEKPYTITGGANFSNQGRLYFKAAGDSIEYTWPHTIIGVSGFRSVDPLVNGVDMGNTASRLEGLYKEYKIDTGSGYGAWKELTAANLSGESVSSTAGFGLKIRLTAKLGMKYISSVKNFVQGETIRGLSSLATATVDKIDSLVTYGTLWLTNVVGDFTPGEVIVKDSNGEMRATNVATATVFGTFPAPTSYIDGLQIYTTVNQGDLYPPERQTLSLTGLQPNSEIRIYSAGTTTELAGIENSTTTFEYKYLYAPNIYVDIVILHLDYTYYKIENYLLSSADASIPIVQIVDRVYENQ